MRHLKIEDTMQLHFVNWFKMQHPKHSKFLRSDVASGMYLKDRPWIAAKFRALQGSRAWPDIQVSVPMKGYYGFFLELKKEGVKIFKKDGFTYRKNEHIQEQADMLDELNNLNYFAEFAVGLDEAIKYTDWYFGESKKDIIDLKEELRGGIF